MKKLKMAKHNSITFEEGCDKYLREYVLQLNSVKKQVITRLSGYAMKRSFIY